MSNQDGRRNRTAKGDREAWLEYWEQQGQPWRTEPEIDAERQEYLERFRSRSRVNWNNAKLSRADIEWLLATHDNGRGPIDWSGTSQRGRKGLNLRGADLSGVDLSSLPLANMIGGGNSVISRGTGVNLSGTNLQYTHLEGTQLARVNLSKSFLGESHLEGANLSGADLHGADLSGAYFDGDTKLNEIFLSDKDHDAAILVDIHWGEVNVAVVDWSLLSKLGDMGTWRSIYNFRSQVGIRRSIYNFRSQVRAYRQLSVVLKNQGLNEDANRFAYHAQLMQRKVYKRLRKRRQYLGSLFLDLLTGYGYKPLRSFLAYLIVILTFATAYFILGRTVGPALSPLGSVVFSMTSFHGRGFFPGGITLDDPLTVLAALEAFVGLLIEVTFIATLTRRLFGG